MLSDHLGPSGIVTVVSVIAAILSVLTVFITYRSARREGNKLNDDFTRLRERVGEIAKAEEKKASAAHAAVPDANSSAQN